MSNNNTPQIFQTDKPTRWKRFKWTGRVLLMIAIFFFVILGIALYSGSLPNIPNLQAKAREYETTLDPSNPLILKNHQNSKYKVQSTKLNRPPICVLSTCGCNLHTS